MGISLTPVVDDRPDVEQLTTSLCALCQQLEGCPTLQPGPEVDALFERLVSLVVTTPLDRAQAVLADPTLRAVRPRLLELCAQGEQRLELAWADRIAASPTPHGELARFPYLDNYRQLSRMEVDLLASAADRPVRSVAFVGCGPLPLSALLLADQLDVPVDCLDRDPTALAAAERVAHRLDGDPDVGAVAERVAGRVGCRTLRFRQVDAMDADLSAYDVVVLAALVGTTPTGKSTILRRMARGMAPGALLLARSARGLRTLLYPAIDLRNVTGFDLLTVVHPVDDVINSALVARVQDVRGDLPTSVATPTSPDRPASVARHGSVS